VKTLIIALLVLGLAVVVGLVLHTDPGQVVLGYETFTVETSLAFLLIALAVLFTIFYLVLRAIGGLFELPRWMRRRRVIKRRNQAQRGLTRGLLALSEGRWDSAEHELTHIAQRHRSTALLGFLGAAQAAQERGNTDKRDQYLRNAEALGREAELSVGLTRTRLLLARGDNAEAGEILDDLARNYPRNAHVLALRAGLLYERGEWDDLQTLLPVLRKRKAISAEKLAKLERCAWLGSLDSASDAELPARWQRLPKRARTDATAVAMLARRQIAQGNAGEAERTLRTALNRQWNEELAALYGEVEADDVARQIDHAERWLKAHPESPAMLDTLGRLCVRRRLWGKARSAFESSLQLQADAGTQRRYAALLEQLDEPDAARDAYRRGLALALGDDSSANAEGTAAGTATASESTESTGHLRVVDGKH